MVDGRTWIEQEGLTENPFGGRTLASSAIRQRKEAGSRVGANGMLGVDEWYFSGRMGGRLMGYR